jgi:alpha-ribazole phosphatase
MPLIDLLRHGATERPVILAGRTDHALSPEGWRQFERQTEGKTWSRIVASPLRRAREAAERLGQQRAIAVEIDLDWREIDLGDWEGRTFADLKADAGAAALLAEFYRDPERAAPPNGETWVSLAARVRAALGRLAESADDVLVVAHGGSIRTALTLATNIPVKALWALTIEPATRVTLRLERDGARGLWGEIVEVRQP